MKIPKRVNSRNPETNCAVIVLIISCDGVAGRSRLGGLVIANAGMQKLEAMSAYVKRGARRQVQEALSAIISKLL